MAEQRVTVKLDPLQVQELKDFVRAELAKERQASGRVTAPAGALRDRVERLLESMERTHEGPDMIRADIVRGWLRALLG